MFPLDNKFDMFFNFYGFEDFIDRMHFLFTVKVVVTYLVVMSFTDILTPRIKCWSPHHFVKSWEQYAETYCFIHSTYYYTNSSIVEGTEGKKHGFHFWATYVLAIQAILFATPAVIAAFLTKKPTANILSLINTNVESPSKEDEISKHLQFKLSSYLKFYRINSSIFGFNNVACSYLTLSHAFVKFLFLTNAVTQFIAVSWIFKRKSFFWGVEVAVEYLKTGKWSQSEHFPITTFCDFNVREMNQVINHTVQCMIGVNAIHDKFFFLQWFWLFFCSIATTAHFIIWTRSSFSLSNHVDFINQCLELTTKDKDKYHNDLVVKFTKEILQWDGVKLLQLIKFKLSNIAAKTITRNLFREFTKECCVTSGNEETVISIENSREERRNQKNGERKQTLPFPRDMSRTVVADTSNKTVTNGNDHHLRCESPTRITLCISEDHQAVHYSLRWTVSYFQNLNPFIVASFTTVFCPLLRTVSSSQIWNQYMVYLIQSCFPFTFLNRILLTKWLRYNRFPFRSCIKYKL
ncbi:innexin superfamily [Trichinella spiralis]|uniref:innexin superfamily n=1 Tax=Trichinella spiralis TaxID=6334 RepID=UPI0001EFE8F3|nr:innexin superfamily [Trichinella spiralis]